MFESGPTRLTTAHLKDGGAPAHRQALKTFGRELVSIGGEEPGGAIGSVYAGTTESCAALLLELEARIQAFEELQRIGRPARPLACG